MNKLLSKALAKTFALHVLATIVIYAVPFRVNFLVFHLVVLVWLLGTSGRSRSPYFYGITVLMSIMAIGSFLHESYLLPIFYLLLLPYWVQAGRYAIKNPYAIPLTSLYRLPAMFSRLFSAYKVYSWAASKGFWHGTWLIRCLCILVILQLILMILINNLDTSNSIDLFILRIRHLGGDWPSYTIIPIQVLIQLFIRNASTRFDGYYKVKPLRYHQSRSGPPPLTISEKMGPFAWIILTTTVGFGATAIIPIFLFLILCLIVAMFDDTWMNEYIWLNLFLVCSYAFILYSTLPGRYNQSVTVPSWQNWYSLLVAAIISLLMAMPYEHL